MTIRMFGAGCYLFWIRNIIFGIIVSTHEDQIHLMANIHDCNVKLISRNPHQRIAACCPLQDLDQKEAPVSICNGQTCCEGFEQLQTSMVFCIDPMLAHGVISPHVWLWCMVVMSMSTGITGNLNLWHALKVRLSRVSWHRKGQKGQEQRKGCISEFLHRILWLSPLCTVSVYMFLWKNMLTNHYQ